MLSASIRIKAFPPTRAMPLNRRYLIEEVTGTRGYTRTAILTRSNGSSLKVGVSGALDFIPLGAAPRYLPIVPERGAYPSRGQYKKVFWRVLAPDELVADEGTQVDVSEFGSGSAASATVLLSPAGTPFAGRQLRVFPPTLPSPVEAYSFAFPGNVEECASAIGKAVSPFFIPKAGEAVGLLRSWPLRNGMYAFDLASARRPDQWPAFFKARFGRPAKR